MTDQNTEGGAWRCSYGTRHGIDEDCNCAPSNTAVLNAAFPHHPLMNVWAAERSIYARYRRHGATITPTILTSPTREAMA